MRPHIHYGVWPGKIQVAVFSLILSLCICGICVSTTTPVAAEQPDLRTSIVKVAKENIPAVVHVEVTQKTEVSGPMTPFETDPFFRRFFGGPRTPKKFRREMVGLGSGIILDAKGNILTNSHVVAGASKIQVLLSSGESYSAKLIGTDPKTDLAIIRISAKGPLPYVRFGDSDKVEVGEWVVAIGHPRGLDQTVTQGIISAKNRRGIADPSSYQDFLQTDAAINPGNSGGPLLNLRGEVIGVNSAIASASGGFEGIGFAIPSNMVMTIVNALITKGKVERGWLGVSVQDLTPDLARSFGLDKARGALIAEVVKGSPAEKAGLKEGDVVLSYQGKEIADASFLRNEVAVTPIGNNARIMIWRSGRKMDMTARIGSLETAAKTLVASVQERLGAEFRPTTPKEAEKYGLESDEGVVIVSLSQKSPLRAAGIEPRDVILGINGQMIDSMENFVNIIMQLPPRQKALLLVLDHRSGNTGTVGVAIR